jgi:hypothetical protein
MDIHMPAEPNDPTSGPGPHDIRSDTFRFDRSPARPALGLAAIVFAILFNVPYAGLAMTFQYPDVLRASAGEALGLFAQGGGSLVLTWHAFALCALALAPFAIAFSITRDRLQRQPGLALSGAVLGALAGVAQAIGLWRWVFVVPGLATIHADPNAAPDAIRSAEQAFALLNQYGGVAIGEHLGQTLTALFVASVACLQWTERARVNAALGFVTAITILVGTNEGLAIALGASGELFSLATIAGFLGLTTWLIASGLGLLRGPQDGPWTNPSDAARCNPGDTAEILQHGLNDPGAG